jgi:hypothetical protein
MKKTYILILFLAIAACSGLQQPLGLHPENKHYFLYKNKPAILITSGEHYGAVLNLDFDYVTYLDALKANKLNYTRIFTGAYVEDPGAFDISKNNLAPAPLRFVAPWARSSTPGYDNGGNKFDLNTWDPSYFARLKDLIRQADKRNIIVEVTLFSSLYGSKEGWKSSPLHPENNINTTDALDSYKKVHTLENGNILQHQEKMVRKIVSELKEFKNCFMRFRMSPGLIME